MHTSEREIKSNSNTETPLICEHAYAHCGVEDIDLLGRTRHPSGVRAEISASADTALGLRTRPVAAGFGRGPPRSRDARLVLPHAIRVGECAQLRDTLSIKCSARNQIGTIDVMSNGS